jgi:hypothetical protein
VSSLSRVIFDPDSTAPSIPGGVTATSISTSAIRISWSASTDTGGSGLSGYRVYVATSSGGTYSLLQQLSTASLSYDHTGLSSSTQRFYRITAFDGAGNESAVSTTVNATTQGSSSNPLNLFVANFTTPGAQILYNFGGGYDASHGLGTTWFKTHEPTGGPNGTPCVNFTFASGARQFRFGLWAPVLAHTFGSTESIFIRLIRRYHDAMRWTEGGPQHKIAIIGDGDSRCMVYGNYAGPSVGGALGWRSGGGTGPFYAHAIPSYFGLSGINNDWSNDGDIYGSVKAQKNITIDAAGPALITYGNNPNPPIPGPNSAAPTPGNCWYYEQYEFQPGSASGHAFKVWVNNNDYNNPTVVQTPDVKTEIVTTTNWHVNPNIGTYMDDPCAGPGMGYRMSGCAIGRGFDSTWYPG